MKSALPWNGCCAVPDKKESGPSKGPLSFLSAKNLFYHPAEPVLVSAQCHARIGLFVFAALVHVADAHAVRRDKTALCTAFRGTVMSQPLSITILAASGSTQKLTSAEGAMFTLITNNKAENIRTSTRERALKIAKERPCEPCTESTASSWRCPHAGRNAHSRFPVQHWPAAGGEHQLCHFGLTSQSKTGGTGPYEHRLYEDSGFSFERGPLLSLLQNIAQQFVRHRQAARHVERTFEGTSLGRRHGQLSVPPQISVPFAVFRIRKMRFAVLQVFSNQFK